MEHQLKKALPVRDILAYYIFDSVVLDKVLMDNHYNLILDFFYTAASPNVNHKMKFILHKYAQPT
jgi:hypothetical protein